VIPFSAAFPHAVGKPVKVGHNPDDIAITP
jgi:hypothetical protein